MKGKLHGTWRTWDATGVLRQEFNFVNGKPEGPQSNWDERGQLIARGTVTQGVREGTFVIDVLQRNKQLRRRWSSISEQQAAHRTLDRQNRPGRGSLYTGDIGAPPPSGT